MNEFDWVKTSQAVNDIPEGSVGRIVEEQDGSVRVDFGFAVQLCPNESIHLVEYNAEANQRTLTLMRLNARCVQNEKRGDSHSVVFYLDREQFGYVAGKVELRMDEANAFIFQEGGEYHLDLVKK